MKIPLLYVQSEKINVCISIVFYAFAARRQKKYLQGQIGNCKIEGDGIKSITFRCLYILNQ